jgi:hypothetical protein
MHLFLLVENCNAVNLYILHEPLCNKSTKFYKSCPCVSIPLESLSFKDLNSKNTFKSFSFMVQSYLTVVQRSPEIAVQNIENESKKMYISFHHNIIDFTKLNNFVKLNMSSFIAVFSFYCKLNTFC